MAQPILIIITGESGSGKTTLSRRLAHDLGLILLSRDAIKEILFDTLGWKDRNWSHMLGVASYRLLYAQLRQLLQTKANCMIESNFHPDWDTAQLSEAATTAGYRTIQYYCVTAPAMRLARLQQRVASGERHPGHADQDDLALLTVADLDRPARPLGIAGPLAYIDTTTSDPAIYQHLLAQVQQQLTANTAGNLLERSE